MAWCFSQLITNLLRHESVAVHHFTRYIDIALIACIGNHMPTIRFSLTLSLADRIVIIAFNPGNFGSKGRYSLAPRLADRLMNKDDAVRAEKLSAPCDRSTVIAVCGATYRDSLSCFSGCLISPK